MFTPDYAAARSQAAPQQLPRELPYPIAFLVLLIAALSVFLIVGAIVTTPFRLLATGLRVNGGTATVERLAQRFRAGLLLDLRLFIQIELRPLLRRCLMPRR